jgi:hypothetical protein
VFLERIILMKKLQTKKHFPLYRKTIASYASFINQVPCHFYKESMVASKVIYIHFDNLISLYRQSYEWERLGKLIAEQVSNVALNRTESLLFQTPEQRYLYLISFHPDILNTISYFFVSWNSRAFVEQNHKKTFRKKSFPYDFNLS